MNLGSRISDSSTLQVLTYHGSSRLLCYGGAAIIRWIFGAGFGFCVGQRTAGAIGRWAVSVWSLGILLIFPNFLGS